MSSILLAAALSSGVYAAVLSNSSLKLDDGPDWTSMVADELVGLTMKDAGAAYKEGDYLTALQLVKKARLKRPRHPDIMLASTYVHMQLGRFETALEETGRILKLQPRHMQALRLMGQCNEELGRNQAAIASYLAQVALNPEDEKPHYALGAVYFKLGEINKAIQSYLKAVALKPEDAEAHAALGIALFRAERFPVATISLEKALEINPGYAAARNTLGAVYFASGEQEKGMEQVRLALGSDPQFGKAYSNLASMYAMRGEHTKALPGLEAALTLDLADGHAWQTLLLTLERLMKPDEKKPPAPPPEDLKGKALADWHLKSYEAASKAGDFTSGAHHLIRALQADFYRAEILDQLGLLLVESPFSTLSIRFLQMAMAVDPSFEPARRNLELYLKKMSRAKLFTMQQALEKLLKESPDNPNAHRQLARVLAAQDKLEAAIPHYTAAVRLEPRNISNRISLSYTLHQLGRFDPALEVLLSTLEIDHTSREAWDKLLMVVEMMQPKDHPQQGLPLPEPKADFELDDEGIALWHFRQARTYDAQSSNEWVMAVRHLTESIRMNPTIPAPFYLYGGIVRQHLSSRIAVPFYHRANELSPGHNALEKEVTMIRRDAALERAQTRVDLLQRHLAVDPKDSEAAFTLANILLRHDKTAEAITAMKQGLEAQPTNQVARLHLARLLYSEGDVEGAIGQIDTLLKQGVRPPSVLFQRAWLMLQKPSQSPKELKLAVSLLVQARKTMGKETPALFIGTLARAYYLQNDNEKASRTAAEAIPVARLEKNEALVTQLNQELKTYKKALKTP